MYKMRTNMEVNRITSIREFLSLHFTGGCNTSGFHHPYLNYTSLQKNYYNTERTGKWDDVM